MNINRFTTAIKSLSYAVVFIFLFVIIRYSLVLATMTQNPSRIISLAPSITELVFALDAGHLLVGRTIYSDYPTSALQIPSVGTYLCPNIDSIIALNPDLCLALKKVTPTNIITQLEKIGVMVIQLNPQSFDELIEDILLLGEILNRKTTAALLTFHIRSQLTYIQNCIHKTTRRPTTLFQLQNSPIVAAGKGTFIDELITYAGGYNAITHAMAYPNISLEKILTIQPEFIIISDLSMTSQQPLSNSPISYSWLKRTTIPAVANKHIYTVNPDIFARPTLRSLEALRVLVQIFHPEISLDTFSLDVLFNQDKNTYARHK